MKADLQAGWSYRQLQESGVPRSRRNGSGLRYAFGEEGVSVRGRMRRRAIKDPQQRQDAHTQKQRPSALLCMWKDLRGKFLLDDLTASCSPRNPTPASVSSANLEPLPLRLFHGVRFSFSCFFSWVLAEFLVRPRPSPQNNNCLLSSPAAHHLIRAGQGRRCFRLTLNGLGDWN